MGNKLKLNTLKQIFTTQYTYKMGISYDSTPANPDIENTGNIKTEIKEPEPE